MLTSKQRAYLRSLGNELEAIFQIGKSGITEELLAQLDDALEARELIKVKVLKNCLEEPAEVADQVADGLAAQVVQKIGRSFILYRESVEKKRIELP
ncbi:MAG: ribosome assembly RNA-binding protein YhbY [Firmicutes bacterium]|nr:ribosome assembly RNA-binding protein YhbY [Bacillota bacterium]